MFNHLLRLFGLYRYRPPASVPDRAECTFTVESLSSNYEIRTWQYVHYQSILTGGEERLLNWIGSTDYSGYTREECLKWLIDNYREGDENRILLRLADWVPQVRDIARRWVVEHCDQLSLATFRQNTGLILYLVRKERLASDAIMGMIQDSMLRAVGTGSRHELWSFPSPFRRYLYSLSLKKDQALRPRILDDPDPFNRITLLREVEVSALTDEELGRLAHDKSAPIRRLVINARMNSAHPLPQDELLVLACDPNAGLRELAQFWLRRLYKLEAYDVYRVKTGAERFYLADYAKPEDADLFLEGTRSVDSKIRLLCVKALCLSDPVRLRELDLPRLLQANRKLRQRLCESLPAVMTIDELRPLKKVLAATSVGGREMYLALILKKSYWHYIDEALGELVCALSPSLLCSFNAAVLGRTRVYEPLLPELRAKISDRLSQLRQKQFKGLDSALQILDFTMKAP